MTDNPKVGRRRPAPSLERTSGSRPIPVNHAEAMKPNPYPRRVTLDLSDEMYSRLKAEAFRSDKRLSELGREALDVYLPDLQTSVGL